jgi:hypothetical protein
MVGEVFDDRPVRGAQHARDEFPAREEHKGDPGREGQRVRARQESPGRGLKRSCLGADAGLGG